MEIHYRQEGSATWDPIVDSEIPSNVVFARFEICRHLRKSLEISDNFRRRLKRHNSIARTTSPMTFSHNKKTSQIPEMQQYRANDLSNVISPASVGLVGANTSQSKRTQYDRVMIKARVYFEPMGLVWKPHGNSYGN